MAKPKPKPQFTAAQIDNATRVAGIFSASELVSIVNSRKRFAWINFRAGLYHGMGATVGVALAIVLIGFLVYMLGGLPYIGTFLRDLQQNVPKTK
ncbi:hypothetical protein KBC99_00320 [Candidatus Saccharibacteria bacterium]|nr:hypothetical protein [Candidatus Saccharibacteria bacterium]